MKEIIDGLVKAHLSTVEVLGVNKKQINALAELAKMQAETVAMLSTRVNMLEIQISKIIKP